MAWIYLGDNIRIDGIDTPEIKGKYDLERELAINARNF